METNDKWYIVYIGNEQIFKGISVMRGVKTLKGCLKRYCSGNYRAYREMALNIGATHFALIKISECQSNHLHSTYKIKDYIIENKFKLHKA